MRSTGSEFGNLIYLLSYFFLAAQESTQIWWNFIMNKSIFLKMSFQNLAPGSTAKVLFGFKHSVIYIVIQKSLLLGAA